MFLPSQNWKLSRNVSNEIMSLWQGLGLDFIRELQVNNFQSLFCFHFYEIICKEILHDTTLVFFYLVTGYFMQFYQNVYIKHCDIICFILYVIELAQLQWMTESMFFTLGRNRISGQNSESILFRLNISSFGIPLGCWSDIRPLE